MNKLTLLKAPISVNFEITQVCNLCCGFCSSSSATYRHKNPPLEQVKRVIDALAEAEVFEIRWFGGEFTAFKGWKNAVSYAFDKGFFMSFVSNGTLLDSSSAKFLADHGITGGAMSLHGPKEIHNHVVRVEGAFQETIKGIYNCWDQNIGTTILFTPTQSNYRSLYDLAKWLKQNNVPVTDISIGRLCPSGEAIDDWDKRRLILPDYKYLFGIMRDIKNDFGIYAFMGDAFPLCVLPYKDWDLVTGCWQGTGFGQVSYKGDLKSCSILGGAYGNIFTTPLTEIWTERLKKMRSLTYLPKQCRLCPYFCGGGCSASRFGATHYASDEFIPNPDEENIVTLLRRIPGFLSYYGKTLLQKVKPNNKRVKSPDILMTAKPVINCRYSIRQDINGYLGFFKDKGVLSFDELSAKIFHHLNGKNTIHEITHALELKSMSGCSKNSVITFIRSLHEGGFLSFNLN